MDTVEFAFSGEIWHWRGPSPYHFLTIPPEHSAEILAESARLTYGWGMIWADARIGETAWRTAMFRRDGGYVLPVKAAVRKAERLDLGDTVDVRVTVQDL